MTARPDAPSEPVSDEERVATLAAACPIVVLLILDEAPHDPAIFGLMIYHSLMGDAPYAVSPERVSGFARYVREKSKALAIEGWSAQETMRHAWRERDVALGELADIRAELVAAQKRISELEAHTR